MAPVRKAKGVEKVEKIIIPDPNLQVMLAEIRGDVQLVVNKFSAKAREQIMEEQSKEQADKAKKGTFKEPKNFDELYLAAQYQSREGWYGLPASAIRASMVRACTLVGVPMTVARISIFIIADGFDKEDDTPIVRITKGEPVPFYAMVRLPNGSCDVRVRPKFLPGWEAKPRIRFDANQLTLRGVYNILFRAGLQVGVCEGRPGSKNSCGCGWGTFELLNQAPKP